MAMIVEIRIGPELLHRFEAVRVKGAGRGARCTYAVDRVSYNRSHAMTREKELFTIEHDYDDGAIELTRKIMDAYMKEFGKGVHN